MTQKAAACLLAPCVLSTCSVFIWVSGLQDNGGFWVHCISFSFGVSFFMGFGICRYLAFLGGRSTLVLVCLGLSLRGFVVLSFSALRHACFPSSPFSFPRSPPALETSSNFPTFRYGDKAPLSHLYAFTGAFFILTCDETGARLWTGGYDWSGQWCRLWTKGGVTSERRGPLQSPTKSSPQAQQQQQ
jgi:hypothetical protein